MERRLILDTNVLIEIERQTLDLDLLGEDNIALATITAAEYLEGVELRPNTRRAQLRSEYWRRFSTICDLLEYTPSTAVHHARLLAHTRKAGRPRRAHDLIVAAHAQETGRTVLSKDGWARFGELPNIEMLEVQDLRLG